MTLRGNTWRWEPLPPLLRVFAPHPTSAKVYIDTDGRRIPLPNELPRIASVVVSIGGVK